MSVKIKLFGGFLLIVALAAMQALYSINSLSSVGGLIKHMYEGPLMGVSTPARPTRSS